MCWSRLFWLFDVICVFNCFQVCYVRFESVQRWGPCLISMLGPQGLCNSEFRWVKVETVGNDIEGPTNFQWTYDVGFPCSMLGLWYYGTQEIETLKSGSFRKKRRACTVWTQQLKNLFIHFSTSIPKRLHGYPIKKTQTMQQKRRHIKTGQTTRLWQTGFWASYDRFAKGGAEATIVGVDGDGDLHVFSEIHGTQVTRQRCFRSF